ncbi:MAG: hypothetical protein OHK93_006618 [Ramalina farinacea]|uniref:RRN6 beta-propeller domain-containing protein n=1 Tax=Ramalina farinacea TaxID=258253 RepID=A0AA43TTP8_9LECA|nr:hypothetical protein [Ramalina farinacea]
MTEIRTKDLTYGHFGEPTYDTESQKWHFPREVSTNGHIQPLGSTQYITSDSIQVDVRDNLSSSSKIKGLDRAAAFYPETQPAFDAILGRIQGSAAGDRVPLPYDVSKSDLLAVGTAGYAKASRHIAHVPIVAFPGGSAAELVTFVTLQNEQLRWEQTSPLGINRLTAAGGIQGFWNGFGNPVQQIVSAVGVDGDSSGLFAVRHHKAVSILQPRLYDNLQFSPMKPYDENILPPSRLLPHEVAIIGGNEADAVPFSDVAFNPWFPEQIATLDQTGVWHVWDVELKSKAKGLWSLNSVDTGSLPSTHPSPDSAQETDDCWGRVLWVKDLRTLLLAQRRKLSLVRIRGKVNTDGIPDLGLTYSTDWILDVKRSPANPAHVFVVTSTRLIWLAVLPVDEMAYDDGGTVDFTVLLSWVHYRNPQDLSLGLETCQNEQDGRATST